jgi:hypothetical protein
LVHVGAVVVGIEIADNVFWTAGVAEIVYFFLVRIESTDCGMVEVDDGIVPSRSSLENSKVQNSPHVRVKGWTDEVVSVRYCL